MIGQTISHYKIMEKLGEGGMGVVYKAHDTKLDRTVALKFLPPSATISEDEKKRFIHEARAASGLDHSNICIIYEIEETEDGQLFIVMPAYEGDTLSKKIEQGPFKIDKAIDIACQITEGLQAAHEKGIVHRDVKSSNIFITQKDQVKIMDFGLARKSDMSQITQKGMTLGTVPYMSPEQARGEKLDHRTDIWSLGVVLYEIISGRLPFQSDYAEALVYSIINEEPEPLTSLRSNVPMELERIVKKAMQKERTKRYQRLEDMLIDLRELRRGFDTDPATRIAARPTNTSRRNLWVYGGVGSALLITLIGIFYFTQVPSQSIPSEGTSIAVLPFLNMSLDPENAYFADGISEELLNVLAGVDGLTVASRTSAFSFKGKDIPIPEIARQLGVRHVLEGSVRKQDDRVRITAQLIDAGADAHLWSQTYERDLIDIFRVQEEIARAITTALEGILGSRRIAVDAPTDDMEAYQSFLRGRTRFYQRIELDQAIDDLQHAVDRDPEFSEAWAFLAAATGVVSSGGYPTKLDPAALAARSFSAGDRAIELDPMQPLALAGKGRTLFNSGDMEGMVEGISLLERAADRVNPDTSPLLWLGITWAELGYLDRALPRFESAQVQDPLVGINNGYLGYVYAVMGRDEDAERFGRRAMELSRHPYWTQLVAIEAANRGDFDRALDLMRSASEHWNIENDGLIAAFVDTSARESLLESLSIENVNEAAGVVMLSLLFGDADRMFDAVMHTHESGQNYMRFSAWLPSLGWLREDPRFFEFMQTKGIVGYWETHGFPPGCYPVNASDGRRLDCRGYLQ
jgi:serine/threonine protein kinase/tetratricopeptide (TPR) repeat protein